jgi:hypothetical protein
VVAAIICVRYVILPVVGVVVVKSARELGFLPPDTLYQYVLMLQFALPPAMTIGEFLTHKTTCASEMLEKTTCQKICQKRPPTSGGTSGEATRGTCRLGRRRQVHAATAKAGMWLGWLLRR